jgi:DNA-binding winged helix-turn-helix (wHTH) protein
MYEIGSWQFDPQSGILKQGSLVKSLEDRSARVLEVLCRRRGDIVSKEELLAQVWQGRAVSPNSVAIVIGDLRRALGDPASEPAHIVTLGKRGYRLTANAGATPAQARRHVPWYLLMSGVLLVITAAGALISRARPQLPVDLIVMPARNETGSGEYGGLARSMTAVVTDRASRFADSRLLASATSHLPESRLIVLDSRLILWNGAPELAVTATDASTQTVIWSTFASGNPRDLAKNASRKLNGLQAVLSRRRDDPRGIL